MRATRLARLAAFFSSAGRLRSHAPIAEARPSSTTRLPNSQKNSRGMWPGHRSCGHRPTARSRVARALEESVAILAGIRPSGAPNRTVQTMGTGRSRPWAGCDAGCRDTRGSARRAGTRRPAGRGRCESARAAALAPRVPSGKMISESPVAQRDAQRLERIDGRIGLGAIDEHRAERARGDVAPESRCPSSRAPPPGACAAQAARQRRPDGQRVDVAGVIGEVDALRRRGRRCRSSARRRRPAV